MSPTAPVLSLGIETHNDQPPAAEIQDIAKSLAKSSISPAKSVPVPTASATKSTTSSAAQPMLSLGLNKPAMDKIEAEYEPPTVSMAEDCNTEDFNKKSFALKRTRSMGVFDDYIRPQTDLVGKIEDYPHLQTDENNSSVAPKASTSSNGHASFSPSSSSTSLSTAKDSPVSIATVATTASGSTSHSVHPPQCDDISVSNSSSPSAPGTPDLPNDDSVIHHTPQRFVDYFSHDWKESDVSSCWRYIVLRRKDVANSARLENASWRTWTKAKYNLKTVAPESVNWLKDYDVTWLYGPLYDEKPHSFSLTGSADDLHKKSDETPSNTSKQVSNSSPSLPATKPILKKKTPFELLGEGMGAPFLTHSACNGTPNCSCEYHYQKRHNHMHGHEGDEIESSNYLRHHNYRHRPHTQSTEYISNTINKQYSYPRLSEERLSTPSIHSSSSGSSLSLSMSKQQPPSQIPHEVVRSVHFNDRVDQCMAIDGFDSEDEDSEAERYRPATPGSSFTTGGNSEDEDGDDDSDSDGEDDDGLFLMVRSASSTSLHHHGMAQLADTRSESNHSDANSVASGHSSARSNPHPTITLLPATRLKYKLDEEEELLRQESQAKSVAYSMMHQSSYNTERRGGGASRTYDYNSVYTSPGTSPNQSPYPSISYKMNEVDAPIQGPSPTSTRSASSQHTTTDNVMGHVQLSPNGSATGLLGKISGNSTPSSYGNETEFVEDTGARTPQQYESHFTASSSPEGDVVDLSYNDQEALRNLARGDQAIPSGVVYDNSRLGSAVNSAKKLWKASSWKQN